MLSEIGQLQDFTGRLKVSEVDEMTTFVQAHCLEFSTANACMSTPNAPVARWKPPVDPAIKEIKFEHYISVYGRSKGGSACGGVGGGPRFQKSDHKSLPFNSDSDPAVADIKQLTNLRYRDEWALKLLDLEEAETVEWDIDGDGGINSGLSILPVLLGLVEASVGSGEPLLGLKLGKRTYIEDVSAGSNAKNLSYQSTPGPSPISAKRSKPNCQGTCVPHCQVEGCSMACRSLMKRREVVAGVFLTTMQDAANHKQTIPLQCCKTFVIECVTSYVRKNFFRNTVLSNFVGVEESTVTSDMATTQDLHRALSLFCQMIPGFLVSQNTVRLPTPCMSILPPAFQPAMNAIPQGFLSTLSETWLMEHQTAESQVHNRDSDSHFRVSQLLKAPYDNGFYSDQMNRLC
ncbi:hypothetical protein F3Y22_tig00109972pilonHSYRG00405 [Hibiscus syriacus]|uniref:Uncharacterized protein n=1 Tax=Hibiscus syriacus TaxID=106335 RepID=A0A6A3BWD1_HIBSY|nr:hypothetical protein F3Y22_tig00109972pilonHSYRG00405 [Hibiscus syriacus]